MALSPASAVPPVSQADLAGFSAFFDSLLAQSGGTVMAPGGKAGALHKDGPFKGLTSEQGRAEAMRLWQSMPPEQRAQYSPQPAPAPAAGSPSPSSASSAVPSPQPAAPRTAFAPPPKGFTGLEALYQMNPQLRRAAPPAIGGTSPSPSLPFSASPPLQPLPAGVAQQGASGDVRLDNGASILGAPGGPRVLAAPNGGSGSATPISPGQSRPPAVFTNMETGQPQTLAQATAGRAVLPAPSGPAPAPVPASRALTGTATAGGDRALTTAPPQTTFQKPPGAMPITPTSTALVDGIRATGKVGSGSPSAPGAGAPTTGVQKAVLPPPPGQPPRLMTPIQEGVSAVRDTVVKTASTLTNTASKAVNTVADTRDKVADKAATAILWPVTPRPVQ